MTYLGYLPALVVLAVLTGSTTELCAQGVPGRTTSAAQQSLKSYSNSGQAIAFDYPASWILIDDAPRDGVTFAVRLLTPNENVPIMRERSPGAFAISIFVNPRRLDARGWLDENGWPFGSERAASDIVVAGKRGLDVSTNRMFAPNRFVYLADGDRMIRLALLASESQAIMDSMRLGP